MPEANERCARRGIPSADALMPEANATQRDTPSAEALMSEANATHNGPFQVQMHRCPDNSDGAERALGRRQRA
eukprot:15467823-Alexandrium_andersonii.AAC.1